MTPARPRLDLDRRHPRRLLAPGAKLEKLWGEGAFTEGGALAGDGSILFSDIGDRIMRFDPKTGAVTAFRDPSGRANGLIFDPKGRLIAAEGANTGGNRRVSITERDGTVRTLADRYQGKRFNSPNDVAVDARGASTSPTPATSATSPASSTSRPSSGSTPTAPSTRLETTARKPNGLAVSPRRQDPLRRRQRPDPPGPARARPRRRRATSPAPGSSHDFGNGRGIDGMTVTTDGRIVATAGSGDKAGVYVYRARRHPGRLHPRRPSRPPTSSSAAPTARPSTSPPG